MAPAHEQNEKKINVAGVKVQKKVTDCASIKTTDYLDGFQYSNNLLEFFPHAEGYVKVTAMGVNPNNSSYVYNYVYNYTDHLGNIRVSYTKDSQTGKLKILDESHYYPFGLKHQKYLTSTFVSNSNNQVVISPVLNNPYQYKYNGKEFQDELGLNFYDYGWRNYMSDIGRWGNYDPLAEQMRRHSPYNYAFDNPIYFIDPDGRKGTDWFSDKNGNIKFNPTLTKENASNVLKDGEQWIAHEGSVDDYRLNANGTFTDNKTRKNYSGGQSVTLDSGFTVSSHTSKGRAVVNYVTDDVVAPVMEGAQIIGTIFKGALYDIPKEIIETGEAENIHIRGDLNLKTFENGSLTTKTFKDDEIMTPKEKRDAFVKPAVSALIAPLDLGGGFLKNFGITTGVTEAAKWLIDQIDDN